MAVKSPDNGLMIIENTNALPRFDVYSAHTISSPEQFIRISLANASVPDRKVVLSELPENYSAEVVINESPKVVAEEDLPGRIRVSVSGPGWLVIRDWLLPGWRCYDQTGKQIPIVKADGGVMAVFAADAKNQLEFKYSPPGFKMGCMLLLFGLFWLVIDGSYGIKKNA